jgi:hypothetical protein
MAHSGDGYATMFAIYTRGMTTMRTLRDDDRAGLCSIYPPGGTRNVDPTVSGGSVPEDACDPTPRHGFSTQCGQPPSRGCAVADARGAGTDSRSAGTDLALAVGALTMIVGAARRRVRCAT